MSLHLHIVAFTLPYPPDYGGVIDVFYKIRFLSKAGVKVHLHYFSYGMQPGEESARRSALEPLCESINAYPRKTGFYSFCSTKPYIVRSRRSEELIRNLCRDAYPILFEGLHSCYYLDDPRLKNRLLLYRESNIEHDYYRQLSRAESSLAKKVYFLTESLKLKPYQKTIGHCTKILTVSGSDTQYLSQEFPGKEIRLIPSFHKDDTVVSKPGKGNYTLYHGNLGVPENSAAAIYLMKEIWTDAMPELVIAGKNPAAKLLRIASGRQNIRIIPNPDAETMEALIRDAQINLMLTFQPTGLKLKLLNALFNGRFCLVNHAMLSGTGLEPACAVAETPQRFRELVAQLFTQTFSEKEIEERRTILQSAYSNQKNGECLINAITQ